MATVFASHFASVGFSALLTQFGENITYLPRAGGKRVVKAIVNRDPPEFLGVSGEVVLPTVSVRVKGSCKTGIAANELDSGSDQIELKLHDGDTAPRRFSVVQMQSESSGVTSLALK